MSKTFNMSSDEEFDEDAYVIQYNGFRDNYIENIRRCYTAKLLTDAQLVTVDSKVFDVHRVVLSANSAFFFDTFQRLGNRPSVYLSNVNGDMLKLVLKFMYNGIIEVSPDKVPAFMCAAESLQVRGLSKTVDEVLEAVSVAPIMVDVTDMNVPIVRRNPNNARPASNAQVADSNNNRNKTIAEQANEALGGEADEAFDNAMNAMRRNPFNSTPTDNAQASTSGVSKKTIAEQAQDAMDETVNEMFQMVMNPKSADEPREDSESDGAEKSSPSVFAVPRVPKARARRTKPVKQAPVAQDLKIKQELVDAFDNAASEQDGYGLQINDERGLKLVYNGFTYKRYFVTKKNIAERKISWICIHSRRASDPYGTCSAQVTTTGNEVTTDGSHQHIHEPVQTEIPVVRFIDMDKFDFTVLKVY